MRFALAVLSVLSAALLLALHAHPYPVRSPAVCEARAVSVDRSWRLYSGSGPRDDELAGLIYVAEHEGFVQECLMPRSCRAFRKALAWNKVTGKIPADAPEYVSLLFGLLRRSCGV